MRSYLIANGIKYDKQDDNLTLIEKAIQNNGNYELIDKNKRRLS